MPNRYFSRADRKEQIELALAIKADHGGSAEGTAYSIARLVDMAVSPNLYSILADMVAEHRLNVRDEEIENRCVRTFYALPDETYKRLTRLDNSIKINGRLVQRSLL